MQHIGQLGVSIDARCESGSVGLPQSRDEGVAVFLANRPVSIAMALMKPRLFQSAITSQLATTSYAANN